MKTTSRLTDPVDAVEHLAPLADRGSDCRPPVFGFLRNDAGKEKV